MKSDRSLVYILLEKLELPFGSDGVYWAAFLLSTPLMCQMKIIGPLREVTLAYQYASILAGIVGYYSVHPTLHLGAPNRSRDCKPQKAATEESCIDRMPFHF